MNTTLKLQSANRKTKIITIFLGMFIILASGWLLASIRYGAEVIAPALMFLFALCLIFFAIWSEKNWWAIIPGGICASIGLVVTMEMLISDSDRSGQAMMFLFALSFIIFAIRSKKNWWAIIPAGFFASLGMVVALDILVPHAAYPSLPGTLNWGFYTCVLFLGLATTFGILWLLRKILPTELGHLPGRGFPDHRSAIHHRGRALLRILA